MCFALFIRARRAERAPMCSRMLSVRTQ